MISVVIVNFHNDDAELLKRMKYNLEKAGFSLTESYTSGVVSEKQSDAGILVDTIALVYNKNYEKP
jgi:hypothetical protein